MTRNGYALADFDRIIAGDVHLPNFEAKEPAGIVIGNIASLGHNLLPKWGHAKMADGHKAWAMYFLLPAGMSGARDGTLSGEGYVLIYAGYPHHGIAGTFAICKHEKKSAPGANPSRGWHPGACSKCGLDMTGDSGD